MHRLALALLLFPLSCRHSEPSAPSTSNAPFAEPVPGPAASPGARALFDEALARRRSGDDAGARVALDLALREAPAFALASLERAELLLDAGEVAAGASDAALAAAALPENPRAQRVLGRAREDAGDLPGAILAYTGSLAVRDDAPLRRRLAALLARAGRVEEATRLWEQLRAADARDPGAHLELAQLYERLDRPASAEAEYDAVLALTPANAVLHRRFADFLGREGKGAKARAERQKAEALAPSPHDDRKLRPLQPSSR